MTREQLIELLGDDEVVTLLEGSQFDAAIIGLAERFGMCRSVCYDYQKVLNILKRQGMTDEEAVEWYDFNMIGAWMGETTPIFLRRIMRTPSTHAKAATSSAIRPKAKPDAP